jgi:hypothetical protein
LVQKYFVEFVFGPTPKKFCNLPTFKKNILSTYPSKKMGQQQSNSSNTDATTPTTTDQEPTTNQNFIQQYAQKQRETINKQDQELDQINASLDRIRNMALGINDELSNQKSDIEKLDQLVVKNQKLLDRNNKKLKKDFNIN